MIICGATPSLATDTPIYRPILHGQTAAPAIHPRRVNIGVASPAGEFSMHLCRHTEPNCGNFKGAALISRRPPARDLRVTSMTFDLRPSARPVDIQIRSGDLASSRPAASPILRADMIISWRPLFNRVAAAAGRPTRKKAIRRLVRSSHQLTARAEIT